MCFRLNQDQSQTSFHNTQSNPMALMYTVLHSSLIKQIQFQIQIQFPF